MPDIPLEDLKETLINTNNSVDFSGKDGNTIEEQNLDIDSKPLPPHFSWILCALWMCTFLTAVDGTIIANTASDVASYFDQAELVSWIATSYLLTTTAFQPLYGKLSDILGRKQVFQFAQFMFALGLVGCTFSNSIPQLSFWRAVSGVGGGGTGAMTNIIITDAVPLSRRSIYVGYGSLIYGVSQSLGGPLGGFLLGTVGFRGMFVVQIPIMIASMFVMQKYYNDNADHIPENKFTKENLKRIDFGGSISLSLLISSFIFFLQDAKFVTFCIMIISGLAFVLIEKYVAVETIMPFYILKGELSIIAALNGISSMVIYFALFVIPLYLQIVQGISVTDTGTYMISVVMSISLGSLVAGFFLRKFGTDKSSTMKCSAILLIFSVVAGLFGSAMVYKVILQIEPDSTSNWRPALLTGLAITGFTQGFQSVSILMYNVAKVGKQGQAVATSVTFLFRSLGNVLSVSVSLSVYVTSLSHHLVRDVFHGESEEFQKIIKDSLYVRNDLDSEYLPQVLLAFKRALVTSCTPTVILSLMNLGFAYVLYKMVLSRSRALEV